MKLGLVTYNLAKDWDLQTIVKNCAAHDFKGVELRTQHQHGVESNLTQEQRAEVRRMFEESPVELVGLGTIFEFHSLDPDEVRRNIEGTKEYVKLAHDVGASSVKVRPNGHQEAAGVSREKSLEQIGKAVHECAAFAQDYGVEIRVEMHGSVSAAADMRKIIDYADHPNATLVWNSNPVDVHDGSIRDAYELVADKIGLCHINEICNRAYPYRELFGLLQKDNYQGYCLAEIQGIADAERLMDYYRALFEALAELGLKSE